MNAFACINFIMYFSNILAALLQCLKRMIKKEAINSTAPLSLLISAPMLRKFIVTIREAGSIPTLISFPPQTASTILSPSLSIF